MSAASCVIRVRYRRAGGHVDLRVFVGPDTDHFALAGELTLREEEFHGFIDGLSRAEFVNDEPSGGAR